MVHGERSRGCGHSKGKVGAGGMEEGKGKGKSKGKGKGKGKGKAEVGGVSGYGGGEGPRRALTGVYLYGIEG
jgi:hypothetical protein